MRCSKCARCTFVFEQITSRAKQPGEATCSISPPVRTCHRREKLFDAVLHLSEHDPSAALSAIFDVYKICFSTLGPNHCSCSEKDSLIAVWRKGTMFFSIFFNSQPCRVPLMVSGMHRARLFLLTINRSFLTWLESSFNERLCRWHADYLLIRINR